MGDTDQDICLFDEQIATHPNKVEYAEEKTELILIKLGFSNEERDSIAIAVTEAVNNAIYHGNKLDSSKTFGFQIFHNADEKYVRFVVTDAGTGFDPESSPDPLRPENLLKESGRGLFIIKHLMDAVEYDFGKQGTTVSLLKYYKA